MRAMTRRALARSATISAGAAIAVPPKTPLARSCMATLQHTRLGAVAYGRICPVHVWPVLRCPPRTEHADDAWITANGARMVARAWTDPEYRARMLVDGTAAARELGFEFPEHHRNLVVLENTPTVHNVIVCTLALARLTPSS